MITYYIYDAVEEKIQNLKPYLQDDFSTQKGKRTCIEYIVEEIQDRNAGDYIFMMIFEFLRHYSW